MINIIFRNNTMIRLRINRLLDFVHRPVYKSLLILSVTHHRQNPSESTMIRILAIKILNRILILVILMIQSLLKKTDGAP
jgi:hypothetical protein